MRTRQWFVINSYRKKRVFLDNVATDQTQTSKNGDKEQYYIRGGIWDLVADFENKILIHIKNGEEFLRDKCK